MKSRLKAMAGMTLAVVAALVALGSASAPAQMSTETAGVKILAQRGFGDSRNSYSWGMAWFKGKLYVGTGRQVACVEVETRAFYLPNLHLYNTNPAINTKCPADPYNMALRAEIWQYNPHNGVWRRVYRSPVIPNPRAPGKTIARDIAYRGMAVSRDGRGHKALYVAGLTANEYIPELAKKYPPRLLHTSDGRHFRATTPKPDFTVTTGYGTVRPQGWRSMETIDGRFFATATVGLTGNAAVVEIKRPWDSRRARFKQVSPTNVDVFEIEKFHNHLYAGAGNDKTGYEVWRALDRNPRSDRWTVLVNNGAGRGVQLTSVVSMHVYKGQLYVGSSGWANEQQTLPAVEIIRIRPDNSWDLVMGNPRTDHGMLRFPISGLNDGFGSGFAAHPWRMETRKGGLYVGTNDFSANFINQPGTIIQAALTPEYGFDIWSTCDGRYWSPVTRDAFGSHPFDFGARTIVNTPQGLAIGSANHAQGTTVFLDQRNACGSGIKTGKKAKASSAGAPGSLLADPQRDGTVLSWDGAAAGVTYHVMRAEMPTVRLSVKGAPSGVEGATPQIVPAGTPGSEAVGVVGYDRFTQIGTTDKPVFVDHSRVAGKRYAYKVVAVAADGSVAGTTGVQTVPGADPLPTVGLLRREVAAQSGSALAASTGSGPAAVAQLRAAAGSNADLRDSVDRLARSLRYRDLAGGPVKKG